MSHRLYPCPRCGKEDASWDGETYCGKCQEAYQRENEEFDVLTDANFADWAASINR
jgi:uncharacterized Zn finger protein (UPF0148 family)